MTEVITFEQALKQTQGVERSLLLGNGFSIEYFSYSDLLSASGIDDSAPLARLFKELETVDFEEVMESLECAARVASVYGYVDTSERFSDEADALRDALIRAVKKCHPASKTCIQDIMPNCLKFIKNFQKIFTLNYDLLLYWVRLESLSKFSDGFGLGDLTGSYIGPYKKEASCNIYNVHGGLHLFRTSDDEVEKVVASDTLISDITQIIHDQKRMPLYVAEGTSKKKLAKIRSVPYLEDCLNALKETSGAIFVYGHSASQNDEHIYRALFDGNEIPQCVYFCVYDLDKVKIAAIEGELRRYSAKYQSQAEIVLVDAKSANVWG